MSKMFVIKESNDKEHQKYNEIKYCEFLEFICRIAFIKYKDDEEGEIEVASKLINLLDELLRLFKVIRKDVEISKEEVSESDDDY